MGITGTVRALLKKSMPSLSRLDRLAEKLAQIDRRLDRLQVAVGRLEHRQITSLSSPFISDYEYQVFSQWGEDGIIQFLLSRISIERKIFVEFGVEDYREANTRFLLVHDNWTGLVIDGSQQHIEHLKTEEVYWRHALTAVHAFVTRDNINRLIAENGVGGEIGLLSVDIDGNDYWVWQAIDVISPAIVVAEYNHRFGAELAVTIPYDENFVRAQKYPVIYFGASLKALCLLAEQKGYAFVGCNSNGINAFFVRKDKLPEDMRALTAEEGYVAGKLTENRDANGAFIRVSPEQEKLLLMSCPLVEIGTASGGLSDTNTPITPIDFSSHSPNADRLS